MQLFSRMVELFTLNSGRVVDALLVLWCRKTFLVFQLFLRERTIVCGGWGRWVGGCTIGNLNQKEAPPIFACKPRCPSDEDEEDVDAEKIISRNIRRTNI